MSRYTDLMSKNYEELTTKEKIELMKLVLEEYDREERRINKLPIDLQTKQECLLNVINAHSYFLEDLITIYRDHENNFTRTERERMSRLSRLKESLKKEVKADKKEQITRKEIAEALSDLNEYGSLLENKGDEKVTFQTVSDAYKNMSIKKSEDKYSLAGDKTITDAQRKALYQFHHWMRKHNVTASMKWAGFGYKGSTVDFSERFMRLPARVQLKALYLVESDRRKNPIEDVDNEISQNYVPNYDKLKDKMTSSRFFARKYLNKSRYLWSKLEQAANIANSENSVAKLKSYTDAMSSRDEHITEPILNFFRDPDSEDDLIKNIIRGKEQLKVDLRNENLDKETRKKMEAELKEKREILKNIKKALHSAGKAEDIISKYDGTDGKISSPDKKKLKSYLKDIETIKEKYQKDDNWFKKYKHVFFKQTNDLAGYTATGTALGTNIYKAKTSNDADPIFNGTAAVLTMPSAIANFINDFRTVIYGKGGWEKVFAGANAVGDLGWATSKGFSIYKMSGLTLNDAATKVSQGITTGAFGVGVAVNLVKSAKSWAESCKSDNIKNDFEILRASLDAEITALKDNNKRTEKEEKKLDKLTKVKQSASWTTLEKASKLIDRDKRRERNANFRRLFGSAVGLAGNICGYFTALNPTIWGTASYAGGPSSTVIGVLSDMRDNVVARNRNREYIEAEYPITDSDRIAAIINYKKQLTECTPGSDEYKEIEDILSHKDKLDNRIRNLKAGQHVRANQEGLKDEIYSGYKNIISDAAKRYKEEQNDINGVIKSDGDIEGIDERYIEVKEEQIDENISTDINTNISTDIDTNSKKNINTDINTNINTNVNNILDNNVALNAPEEVDYEREAGKLMLRFANLLDLNKADKKKTDKKNKKAKIDNKDVGRLSIESDRSSISPERNSIKKRK